MARVLSMLGAVAIAVALAGAAHADTTDDQFIAALDQAGIGYPTPDKAIAAGKAVCDMANGTNGATQLSPINVDIAIQHVNPKLTWDQAVQFVGISENAYCPAG